MSVPDVVKSKGVLNVLGETEADVNRQFEEFLDRTPFAKATRRKTEQLFTSSAHTVQFAWRGRMHWKRELPRRR